MVQLKRYPSTTLSETDAMAELRTAKATEKSTESAVESCSKDAADAATVADDAVEKAKRVPEQEEEVYSDLCGFTREELLAAIEMLPDQRDTCGFGVIPGHVMIRGCMKYCYS